jgi:hypothetical protein
MNAARIARIWRDKNAADIYFCKACHGFIEAALRTQRYLQVFAGAALVANIDNSRLKLLPQIM